MKVKIDMADRRFAINKSFIVSLVKNILKKEAAPEWTLDVIYCRDCDIEPLNRRFKHHRRSTDVLAFDLSDDDRSPHEGEVYVNLQMARRQARENKVSYIEEVKRLTVHGILHLLGYRDDTSQKRSAMWARQESYL